MTQTGPADPNRATTASPDTVTTPARRAVAQFITQMLVPDAADPPRDAGPLAGIRISRDLELAARASARDYISPAREAGHSWPQIGTTLGFRQDRHRLRRRVDIGKAAFDYATERPDGEHDDTVPWTCTTCGSAIADVGGYSDPVNEEVGHSPGCQRLAHATAEWITDWEPGR